MLLRALRPFLARPDVGRVVVTLPRDVGAAPARVAAGPPGRAGDVVAGGATRADSVRAGLDALGDPPPVVLVHDAARPFVEAATIAAVIERARSGVGAVAAVPIGDTVKDVDDDGRVARTVPRDRLWRAQTPQGFPGAMLAAGYAAGRPTHRRPPTMPKRCSGRGSRWRWWPARPRNLKVTTEEDWRWRKRWRGSWDERAAVRDRVGRAGGGAPRGDAPARRGTARVSYGDGVRFGLAAGGGGCPRAGRAQGSGARTSRSCCSWRAGRWPRRRGSRSTNRPAPWPGRSGPDR